MPVPDQEDVRSFYVDDELCHVKDFIDPSSRARPKPTPLPDDPSKTGHPLWLQTAECGSHDSDWPLYETLFRDLRPCIDAAGELFGQFRPDDYHQMMRYNDDIIRSNAKSKKPSVRPPIWDDGYRTPFATMQIRVNSPCRVRPWKVEHESSWSVVVMLGFWIHGGMIYSYGEPGRGLLGPVPMEAGDCWVFKEGCTHGLEEWLGERVMVEFFVPVPGWKPEVEVQD